MKPKKIRRFARPKAQASEGQPPSRRAINILFFLFGIIPFTAAWPYSPYVSWIAEAASIIMALLISAVTFYQTRKSTEIRLTPLAISFAAISILIGVDTLVVQPVYLTLPLTAIFYLLVGVILAIAVHRWRAEDHDVFTPFVWGLFVCSWIQMVFAIAQMTGGLAVYGEWMQNVSLWWPHYYPGPIATGLLFQRNNLADFLFICLLATAYLYNTGAIRKAVFVGWVAMSGVVFSLTLCRSVFAFAACTVIVCLFARWRSKEESLRRYTKSVLIATLAVVVIEGVFIPLSPYLNTQGIFKASVDSGLGRLGRESFLGMRMRLWEKALVIFNEHKTFGVGMGGYGAEAVRLTPRWGFDSKMQEDAFFTHAHNLFINFLAETGIFLTLAILIGVLFIGWSLLKGEWTPKRIFACACALIIFAHSQVEYPLWYSYFLLLLVAVIAFQDSKWVALQIKPKIFNYSIQIAVLACGVLTVVSTVWYVSLVPIANAPINTPITDWERKTLASISNKPIIGEMADFFFLVRLMDYSDRDLQAKLAFTERLATFRPNDFVLFRRAVYLTYAGRDDEALDCIKLAYYNNIESIRAMVAYYNESGADPRLAKIRERLMNYYQEYQNRLKK